MWREPHPELAGPASRVGFVCGRELPWALVPGVLAAWWRAGIDVRRVRHDNSGCLLFKPLVLCSTILTYGTISPVRILSLGPWTIQRQEP